MSDGDNCHANPWSGWTRSAETPESLLLTITDFSL